MAVLPEILITKASGHQEPFSEEQLRRSLQKAGADEVTINEILHEVKLHLYQGISTKKIYRYAFGILRGRSRFLAARYNLKRAIMELGPSGFPFEQFVAEILKQQGYSAKTGEIVEGKCVKHEIDVIAEQDQHHFMVECKYHNRPGLVCDVKIPLYIQARFKDVESKWKELPGHITKFHQGWVVTNTRFTIDAIQYGTCAGLNLIGWDYPAGKGLKDLIDQLGLYPVTCIIGLKKKEKEYLLNNHLILAREVCNNAPLLHLAGIKASRISAILEEARQLCIIAGQKNGKNGKKQESKKD